MRREKAIHLVKGWSNKVCNHPEIEEEYFLGRATGNLLCTICGKTIAKTFNYKVTIKNIFKIKFRM
jgi:ribosomal protein S27E